MKTEIKSVSRPSRRVTGTEIVRDSEGEPVYEAGAIKRALVYAESKHTGFAEVSRSGSIIGEIHPSFLEALNARRKRLDTHAAKHERTVSDQLERAFNPFNRKFCTRITADWQDRRSAFTRN